MKFNFDDRSFNIKRYPPTSNNSLQPWNASDELILEYLSETHPDNGKIALVNDRFGFLASTLFKHKPFSIIDYKSQQKSIEKNYANNSLVLKQKNLFTPLDPLPEIEIGVIKIPKSLEAFEFQVQLLHQSLTSNGTIIAGFMTKYFTPQLLEISDKYFSSVEQSKAKKKARILILKGKKDTDVQLLTGDIKYKYKVYNQYPGVFSSDHIDYGTQFLLDKLELKESENTVLDLACGNGVIADHIVQQNSDIDIHLIDDSFLAVESSKMNINEEAAFHWDDTLDELKDDFFDLIVSNPPFHFGYETNIEVSLGLFEQAKRCLKPAGRLVIVANKHLNYSTHLEKLFKLCSVIDENDKFEVYECIK